MSSENQQATLESYYGYIDRDRYEDLFDLFADDIVYHRPGAEPIRGREDFRQFYLEERPLEDGTHEIEAYHGDGDTMSVRGRFSGMLDGDPIEFGFADFHEFDEDGLIQRRWTYTDLATV
jgi:ketosteroid isomerase-like protein